MHQEKSLRLSDARRHYAKLGDTISMSIDHENFTKISHSPGTRLEVTVQAQKEIKRIVPPPSVGIDSRERGADRVGLAESARINPARRSCCELVDIGPPHRAVRALTYGTYPSWI